MRRAEEQFAARLRHLLPELGRQAARQVLGKAAEEDEALAHLDFTPVATAARAELEPVARAGAQTTLLALSIDDEDITRQTFDEAVDWATDRAAELVGKSWDEDGELIDNPDAEMAITDTMREEIRAAVAQALKEGKPAADLAQDIEGLECFSPDRAEMVARTEIIRAHAQGQVAAMRNSGVVEQKAWSTAGEDVCDDCQANEDEGAIDLEDDFPSGDDAPPAHPMCRCAVVAVIADEDESEEDDDETGEEAAE